MWHASFASVALCFCCIALACLTGCGDKPAPADQARIALANDDPALAIELAQKALKAKPDDAALLLVLGRAQLRLEQMSESRATLDRAIELQPTEPDARRALAAWYFTEMKRTVNQTDFATNAELQARFQQQVEACHDVAEWFKLDADLPAESAYLRGRLAEAQSGRLRIMTEFFRRRTDDGGPIVSDERKAAIERVAALEREGDTFRRAAARAYQDALNLDPRRFDAAERYVGILDIPDDEAEHWALAQRIALQKDLPETLVESAVLKLLDTPDTKRPKDQRVTLGWALYHALDEKVTDTRAALLTGARLYLASPDPSSAGELLDRAGARAGADPTIRFLRARMYVQLGQYQEAKTILGRLATDGSTTNLVPVQMLLAVVYERLGDGQLAEVALVRAMELDKFSTEPRDAYIALRARRQGVESVDKELRRQYEESPGDAATIQMVLRLALARNNTTEARTILARTEQIEKPTRDHLVALVDGYTRLNDLAKAQIAARKLIQADPDSLDSHLRLAEVLLRGGDDAAVDRMVAELRTRFPQSGSADLTLGRLNMDRHAYDKSITYFEAAIKTDPRDIEARFLLARALYRLSVLDDALEHVEILLARDASSVRVLALAAAIHEKRGDEQQASDLLSRIDVTKLNERDDAPLLARLQVRLNHLDEAARICVRAIAQGQTDPLLHTLLADIYARSGQIDAAQHELEARARQHRDSPDAYFDIVDFYKRRDDVLGGLARLKALDDQNATLSMIGQASLLAEAKRYDDALALLTPALQTLIKNRSRLMWSVAQETARLHLIRHDRAAAMAVYDQLIAASAFRGQATLRKLDIEWTSLDAPTRLGKLDALAAMVVGDMPTLKHEIVERYLSLGDRKRALALLDKWIEQDANQLLLRRWRAELLVDLDRGEEAVRELSLTMALSPNDVRLRQALSQAQVRAGDYPAAEETLIEMGRIDAGAQVLSLFELTELYHRLGLNRRAIETLKRLEDAGRPGDPRVAYLRGRSLAALGRDESAHESLAAVPEHAPQYVAAQLLLTRIEQRQGLIDAAQQRVAALARDRDTAETTTRELLALSMQTASDEQLLAWSDRALDIETLPNDVKRAWLLERVGIAGQRRDFTAVLAALDELQQLDPTAQSVLIGRILTRRVFGRDDEARDLLHRDKLFAESALGAAVALSLGVEPVAEVERKGVAPFFAMIANDKLGDAKAYLNAMPESRWLFHRDLSAIVNGIDMLPPELVDAARQTLGVMLAVEVGLPEVGLELAERLTKAHPSYVPGQALRIRALEDMNRSIDDQLAPDASWASSSFGTYLHGWSLARAGKQQEASALLRSLLESEPGHQHVQYLLAQLDQRTGQYDAALELLESLGAMRGRYQFSALNDLAYLLADQYPSKRDEAYKIAERMAPAAVLSPALADTIGWIEHLQGRDDEALQLLTRAALAAGDLPQVQYHLGAVYHAKKQATWARYYLSEAAARKSSAPDVERARALLSEMGGELKTDAK